MRGGMKYQKIIKIEYRQTDKLWVVVTFENGTEWMPELIDVGEIIAKIGYCEDLKFINGEGRYYWWDFIKRIFKNQAYEREEIEYIYRTKKDPNNKKRQDEKD